MKPRLNLCSQQSARESHQTHERALIRPSRISRCCDFQLQRNINQSPRIQCGVAILTNHRTFPENLTNQQRRLELTQTNYLPPHFRVYYVQAIQAFMLHARVQRFTLANKNNCERSRKAASWYSMEDHECHGNNNKEIQINLLFDILMGNKKIKY